MDTHELPHKPKIAISACLVGQEVRFNAGHKASKLCNETLAKYFDFVPLCPEMAIGLGVPRADHGLWQHRLGLFGAGRLFVPLCRGPQS